jgi:hypothetical protein
MFPGLTPWAIICRPVGARPAKRRVTEADTTIPKTIAPICLFPPSGGNRPNGATGNSPGRKPWVRKHTIQNNHIRLS